MGGRLVRAVPAWAACTLLAVVFTVVSSLGVLAQDIVREEGIVYAVHDGYTLRLELARPINGGPHPALIFLPGSGWGWWTGPNYDRHQYTGAIDQAARNGFVAVSIDYRPISGLDGKPTGWRFPSQILDARSAVRWLRANAGKYQIDPARIGSLGWSSGGVLALLLGLAQEVTGARDYDDYPGFSSTVQCVVSIAGPTDLASQYREKLPVRLLWLLGGTPDEVPALYDAASPIRYVSPAAPPILQLWGTADPQTGRSQVESMDAALRAAGAPGVLIEEKYMAHENRWYHPAVLPFLRENLHQ